MLIKRVLLPETINITSITSLPDPKYNITIPERKITEKEIDPKYNILKPIRNSTKKVEVRDLKFNVYSYMYKAAKTFNRQSRLISAYDGKVWRNRYAIKVLTESD